MAFTEYILNNYIMLYELIGLAVLLTISAHLPERSKKQTQIVILLLLAESVAFALERWTQSFATLSILRPILTACVYSIYPAILIAMLQVAATTRLPRRKLLLLLIPWFIAVLLYFTTQWTHLICWFDAENHWKAGPLRFLPYVIFALYTLMFLIYNYRLFRNYSRVNRTTAAYIVIGALLGAVLFMLFDDTRDFSAIFTSAILLYYSLFYAHMAKTDPLTSLQNRQSYYQDLTTEPNKITGAVSVDMNELKYYNDNFGHEAGDKALATIADVLRDNCFRGATVYRVGGDEFMILCRGLSEAEQAAMIRQMREAFTQTPYVCAFGSAMRSESASLEALLVAADEKMYEDKAALKREVVAQGGQLHPRE